MTVSDIFYQYFTTHTAQRIFRLQPKLFKFNKTNINNWIQNVASQFARFGFDKLLLNLNSSKEGTK